MTISLSADEALQIAEQVERNGSRFYRRASQGFADSGARNLLLDLAIIEDSHENAFAAMRAALSPKEREPMVPDPYGEAVLYLQGIADGTLVDVTADPSERLTGKETIEEILTTAIGLEKDSIVLYLGIKRMVPEGLGRPRIDAIIQAEMGHIALLTKELASLKGLKTPA
jgi:rubrerythrin